MIRVPSVAPAAREDFSSLRDYANPPVHEVILSLIFQTPAKREELNLLPPALANVLPIAEQKERAELIIEIGPSGQQGTRTTREYDGWSLKNEGPTRVALLGLTQLSLHAVRPGPWPRGTYAGWKTIRAEMLSTVAILGAAYGRLPIFRAGIRYLNRIAVPKGTELSKWVTLAWEGPPAARDPHAFNLRQTWGRIEGHEDLGVTIGMVKIEIPESEAEIAQSCIGILFDIEVFNLWAHNAPSFQTLGDWTARAHKIENVLFEDCITDDLRARFEEA